jgi:non-specific protein-tyrosine kinase
MLKGPSVMQMVIKQLGLNETPDSLSKKVTVGPVKNTQLIHVMVTDPSSNQAALLANTIANTFITQVQTLPSARFTESLKSIKEKLDAENTTILGIQTNIDSLNAKGVDLDVDLNRQELLLSELRSDYRSLQQRQKALELALTQLPDSVKIADEAHISPIFPTKAIVTVMVGQPPAAEGTDFAMARSVDQLALTFGQIVTARPVLIATIKELNLTISADQLSALITVKPIPGTSLIEITLVSPSPLALANSLAKNFVNRAQAMIAEPYNNRLVIILDQEQTLSASMDQVQTEIKSITAAKVQGDTDLSRLNNDLVNHLSTSRTLQANYDQLSTTASNAKDTVVIAENASPPKFPVDHRLLYLLIASLLSLILGLALAFLLEQLDDRIRTKQDLNSTLGLTNLGTIGKLKRGSPELIMETDPTSLIAEDFRVLAANIRLSALNKPLHKLLITSPKSEDGKSMVAANLAVALAQSGLEVTIVDADLHIPRLQKIFKCDRKTGLTDALLVGNVDVALQPAQTNGLSILVSGHIPPDPSEILNSPKLAKMLDELAKKVDIVVIDSPAILAVADTSILSTLVDGVVVVIRSGHISNQEGKEAIARLRQANALLIGGVLNGISGRSDQYSYHRRKSRGRNLPSWLKPAYMSIAQFLERVWKQVRENKLIQSFRRK